MEIQDTETAVCKDIKARQRLGLAKYGMSVAQNPLELMEWLEHAYQECLDQAIYLKRAMQSLSNQKCGPADPIPLGPEDVPVGSVIRKIDTNNWDMVTCCREGDAFTAAGLNRITWDSLKNSYEIMRPGGGWEPCVKNSNNNL